MVQKLTYTQYGEAGDPEVTYVLEYTPSKMPDSEIIKMAESAEPVE